MKPIVIDIHAHFTPKLVFERFDAHASKFPGVKLKPEGKSYTLQFPGTDPTRPVMPRLSDLEDRRGWMDKNEIDHQMLGGWLDSFGYELEAREGAAWSRFLNDCMWDALKTEQRFTPLATVPLQDGKLAADVLGEAMDKGFGGVMIGTLPAGVRGGNLDDPSLDPFWETASKLGAAVYLHPMFVCGEPRLSDYDMVNAIGRVVDSTIAVTRLLYSGHLLKYSGLKFIVSHGGGALPFALGRLARSHAAGGKVADPRQGFNTMYFDSCVFDVDTFEYLARKVGTGRVMLGSDAPFPIGDPEPRTVIASSSFNEAQKEEMLTGTAQKVFRVRSDCWCRS
ncbi:MAG TPA: amidohydrolase family protein [Burkholderiales bacterium]|nr:amidohydrolase family protein [Burkholderiales bacterium]